MEKKINGYPRPLKKILRRSMKKSSPVCVDELDYKQSPKQAQATRVEMKV